MDLKQTESRSGGSRCLEEDATAEERQGGLESISETVQSTLAVETRPAELPWNLDPPDVFACVCIISDDVCTGGTSLLEVIRFDGRDSIQLS